MRLMHRISLLSALIAHSGQANDITSKTFFSDLPRFRAGTPLRESLFRNDRIETPTNTFMGAFQAVFYGGASTDINDLARYFMPFNHITLNVLEQPQPFAANDPLEDQDFIPAKDLDASHFNIKTVNQNFSSTIQLRPEQSLFGIGLDWKQGVWRDACGKVRLYTEISFPIERVQNRICVIEKIANDGGGADGELGLDGAPHVDSMKAALRQPSWKYGRIDSGKCLTTWGVGDVEVRLGWMSYLSNRTMLDSYIGFVAPTGTKIDQKQARYVFSPVVGNNHHWGLIYGTYTKFDVWEHGCHEIKVINSVTSRILFKNFQTRSFDLKGKDWSRYQEVYSTQLQAQDAAADDNANSGTSGINLFTKCVKVDPRYMVDWNTAFQYTNCSFLLEVGYLMTARHTEDVRLAAWTEQTSLKALSGEGSTSLARTIGKNYEAAITGVDNFADTLINYDTINLASAAHPALIGNLLYGSLGYEWRNIRVPTMLALGASYEFSSINAVIDRWIVWGRIGISF